MTLTSRLACVVALILLAGCAGAQPPPAAAAAASLPAQDVPAAAGDVPAVPAGEKNVPAVPAGEKNISAVPAEPPADTGAYLIGPGDQLRVFVYDSPQLSVDVPVRPDGRISTPLVPDIVAAGKTPRQLSLDLTGQLKKFIQEPNVTVIVTSFVGPLNRQIRIIGEAAEPQAIPYRDHITVLDVMIQAKGLTRYAAGNRAVIVRRVSDRQGSDRQESIRVRLSDLLKDGDINQNVEMQPGDTLIIPQSWF